MLQNVRVRNENVDGGASVLCASVGGRRRIVAGLDCLIFRKALAQGVVRVDGEVHFGGVRQGFEFWPYLFVRRAEHAKVLIDLIDFSSPGE